METNQNSENIFKLSLYQGNILYCEKCFSADVFYPLTRYSVDIRQILPSSITKLQKILSKKTYDYLLKRGNDDFYDLYGYVLDLIESYPQYQRRNMKYNPEVITYQIDNKTIRGVDFKLGFYINDNPIVERVFYVDGFNPTSRWSIDVLETFLSISDDIFNFIKKNDVKNLWNDFYLANKRGLSPNQIKELSLEKRNELLKRLNNY